MVDLNEERALLVVLDSSEQDPDKSMLRVQRLVDRLAQRDERVSDSNRKLGIVQGGLTDNYALVRAVIRSRPNSSYDSVWQVYDITGDTI